MTNPNQITRTYGTDDATLLQFARTTHANVEANLAEFTAFDPQIAAAFLITYLQQIDDIEAFASDNQLIDVQAQHTMDVEAKMKECRDAFQLSKYFIELAFPNRPGTWSEFGYNDYDSARKSHEKMIQFMLVFVNVCIQYQTELSTVGMLPARVGEIQTLTTQLQALNTTQELSKGSRANATNERILMLNALWNNTKRLCNAGKTLYYNNYGKWQLFLLPWLDGGGTAPADNNYFGTIVSGATLNIAIPNLTPNTMLTISNTGGVTLRFCSSTIAGSPCAMGLELVGGAIQTIKLEDLAAGLPNPTFLNVSHTIAPAGSANGEYSVTVIV